MRRTIWPAVLVLGIDARGIQRFKSMIDINNPASIEVSQEGLEPQVLREGQDLQETGNWVLRGSTFTPASKAAKSGSRYRLQTSIFMFSSCLMRNNKL